MSPSARRLAFVVLAICASLLAGCGEDSGPGNITDARWLEARLVAPCCWRQTLDVHESPLAEQLRSEIHSRLAAHERPHSIEDDLVARYGEDMRALPRGRDPRVGLAATVLVALVAVGLFLVRMLRRWNALPERLAETPEAAPRDALDERLDEELRDLD